MVEITNSSYYNITRKFYSKEIGLLVLEKMLKELILIILIKILARIITLVTDSTKYTKLQELGLCIES